MLTLNNSKERCLGIALGMKCLTSKSIDTGSVNFFEHDFLLTKPRLDQRPFFLHVDQLCIKLWYILIIGLGLILIFEEPVEVLSLFPLLLKGVLNLTESFYLRDKAKKLRALHLRKWVVDVGCETISESGDGLVKFNQLLLCVSEEKVQVLLEEWNARRN